MAVKMVSKKNKVTKYVERDISWMYFNHRILQEARHIFKQS